MGDGLAQTKRLSHLLRLQEAADVNAALPIDSGRAFDADLLAQGDLIWDRAVAVNSGHRAAGNRVIEGLIAVSSAPDVAHLDEVAAIDASAWPRKVLNRDSETVVLRHSLVKLHGKAAGGVGEY